MRNAGGCAYVAGVFAEEPTFISTNDGGKLLDVRFEHSHLLWPWSGFLALYIRVSPEGASYKVQSLSQPCGTLSSHFFLVMTSTPERTKHHCMDSCEERMLLAVWSCTL